ncbi:hypothetical protein QI219_03445 [Staphylococcus saprophyticus]|nr:hypothetical protein [Staphylococcus saprophyticus]MDW4257120.1 hypothetical protein [Staphylococcus saprophyticus]
MDKFDSMIHKVVSPIFTFLEKYLTKFGNAYIKIGKKLWIPFVNWASKHRLITYSIIGVGYAFMIITAIYKYLL